MSGENLGPGEVGKSSSSLKDLSESLSPPDSAIAFSRSSWAWVLPPSKVGITDMAGRIHYLVTKGGAQQGLRATGGMGGITQMKKKTNDPSRVVIVKLLSPERRVLVSTNK